MDEQQPSKIKPEKWPYQKEVKNVIIGVVGLWGMSAVIIAIGAWFDPEIMGITGDAFGAINSLFSGLAFAGLIYAIFLQRDELKLQRNELQATRKEFEQQNDTLSRQRFENTFFQMVSMYSQLVINMQHTITWYETPPSDSYAAYRVQAPGIGVFPEKKTPEKKEKQERVYKGREFFGFFFTGLQKEIHNKKANSFEEVNECFDRVYAQFRNQLGSHLKIVSRIVKFAEENGDSDKGFYIDLMRTQLSQDELAVLFYSFCFDTDKYDFRRVFNINEFFVALLYPAPYIPQEHLDFLKRFY
jgi:hypothetical protein